MKIAFDHTIFLIQKYGGISRYFTEITKHLKKKQNIKILCPIYLNNFIDEIDEIKDETFKIKKIKEIPRYCTKLFNKFDFLVNSIYLYQWKPDIIHKTYFNDFEYKNLNAKKVINVWDLSHEIYHKMYNKTKNWRPKINSFKYVDHIICSSQKTQRDLQKFYNVDLKKSSVVYQGVSQLNQNNFKIKKNKEHFLLFVGSRKKYKNFDNLLKAFALNKKLLDDFKLVCFGYEKISKEEVGLIDNLNLNKKNILFVDGNDDKLSEYYLNATALLYPSKNEGFGFPPLEAMSYGCPVITSNNEAILEATGLKNHSFNPDSPAEISSKIEKIIYSKNEIEYLINYGLKRVTQFEWKNTTKELLKIYEKII